MRSAPVDSRGSSFAASIPYAGTTSTFFCPAARLAGELDGSQHGLPQNLARDEAREQVLADLDIEVLRFWNHQWNRNHRGVLMEIWQALHRRTECVQLMRKTYNNRFLPPKPEQINEVPAPPRRWSPRRT